MSVTNGFEKHVQTAIQVLLVAITIWVGSSILSLRDATIRNEERIQSVKDDVAQVKSEIQIVKANTSANGERDYQAQQQVRDLDNRISRMERRRKDGAND